MRYLIFYLSSLFFITLHLTIVSSQRFDNKGLSGAQLNVLWGDMTQSEIRTVESLFTNAHKIDRIVNPASNGVSTITTSSDPQTKQAIEKHVKDMHNLVKRGGKVLLHDPLFAEIAKANAMSDGPKTAAIKVEGGIQNFQVSQNECAVKLVQTHAETVTKFLDRGLLEAVKKHNVPCEV